MTLPQRMIDTPAKKALPIKTFLLPSQPIRLGNMMPAKTLPKKKADKV
jgi:hypothetical protein